MQTYEEMKTLEGKENPEVIVIDIETTGFLESGGQIVEIGIVLLNIKTGTITELFNQTICPSKIFKKSAWIFHNSDLEVSDVLNAELLEVYKEEIQSLLNKYHVTAFNKVFDLGFLRKEGFKIPSELPCIMKALTPIMKIPHSYYGVKYPSVEEAWQFLFPDIPYSEGHRACDDASHEAKILYEMIKKKYYMGGFE